MRPLFILLAACLCTQVHGQTYADMMLQLEAQTLQSRQKLREVMLQKRDLYAATCRMGKSADCDVAALTEVEIVLLDIESKYRRSRSEAGRTAGESASDVRSKVSDLADLVKKAE